jgi:CheY-like chemotaxis protein
MSTAEDYGRILLVDTNRFFVKRLTEELRREGFEVVHCCEPAYALTAVEWNTPVAILCATRFGDSGGYAMPGILQGDAKTRHIPVIAIGEGDNDSPLEAYRAGYHDFVDRRWGAKEIAGHLVSFLRSCRNGFRPSQMLDAAETTLSGNLSGVDLAGVLQMLVQSRQSGTLHINAADSDGIICFEVGKVLHAECEGSAGDTAIVRLVQSCYAADDGVYKFVPGGATAQRTVKNSIESLLLDALRDLDEQECGRQNQREEAL